MYNFSYTVIITAYTSEGESTQLLRINEEGMTSKESREKKKAVIEEFSRKIETALRMGTFCKINNTFFYPYKYAAIKVS